METARRPGTMLRWDCYSSEDLKHAMAYGRKPSREILERLTIDSRIIELGMAYPGDEVAVWQRPMGRRPGQGGRRLPRRVPGVRA